MKNQEGLRFEGKVEEIESDGILKEMKRYKRFSLRKQRASGIYNGDYEGDKVSEFLGGYCFL